MVLSYFRLQETGVVVDGGRLIQPPVDANTIESLTVDGRADLREFFLNMQPTGQVVDFESYVEFLGMEPGEDRYLLSKNWGNRRWPPEWNRVSSTSGVYRKGAQPSFERDEKLPYTLASVTDDNIFDYVWRTPQDFRVNATTYFNDRLRPGGSLSDWYGPTPREMQENQEMRTEGRRSATRAMKRLSQPGSLLAYLGDKRDLFIRMNSVYDKIHKGAESTLEVFSEGALRLGAEREAFTTHELLEETNLPDIQIPNLNIPRRVGAALSRMDELEARNGRWHLKQ